MYTFPTRLIHFHIACLKKNKTFIVFVPFLLSSECLPPRNKKSYEAEVRLQNFCFQKKQKTSPPVSSVPYLIILSLYE